MGHTMSHLAMALDLRRSHVARVYGKSIPTKMTQNPCRVGSPLVSKRRFTSSKTFCACIVFLRRFESLDALFAWSRPMAYIGC